ncbi:hypothetical protein GCM10009560_59100 [Nonomuraea longicatena]|uniref:Uncharacterized protein n=1 Tax=Nonomuraea longicatena TaxID=83682 RepID=A0ABP4B1P0_9ACTN
MKGHNLHPSYSITTRRRLPTCFFLSRSGHNNAIKYADVTDTGDGLEEITLKLSQDPLVLRLVVTDLGSTSSAPALVPLQVPNLFAEHGRGLAIVDALSRGRWGSYRMPRKRHRYVWCHLDRHPTEAQVENLFCAPVAS